MSTLEHVITKADVLAWQQAVPRIYVSPEMRRYLVSVLRSIRTDDRKPAQRLAALDPPARPRVPGPRGSSRGATSSPSRT